MRSYSRNRSLRENRGGAKFPPMLRFRLGSIPVEVHFQHLLFSLLFAWLAQSATWGAPGRWPHPALLDPAHPDHARTQVLYVLVWVALIFVSVLVHELGHAVVSRAFGYQPRIHLLGMGGHTQVGAEEVHPGVDIPWHRDVLLTLAGPGFGLMLAGLSALGLRAVGDHSEVARYVFAAGSLANVIWAVLNLVPIVPLDGGRVARVLLTRLLGERAGQLSAKVLSVTVIGAGVAFALWQRQLVPAALFGLWLMRALASPAGRRTQEAPRERAPRTPEECTLALARQAFREGDLDGARRRCLLLVDDEELPREVRSGSHHLLGWVALKEGKGRLALDHFSQVGERPRVEPQALAAAFSLVGDEPRALSLWEVAYRETKERTVLHEWAGTLIRAGKVDLARKLPGVDLGLAYTCAQRVLFLRDDYTGAARVGLMGLTERPSAQAAYETACAYAQAGEKAKALDLLARAAALGFKDAAYASTDSDLAALRHEPGFARWLAGLEESPSS